SAAPRSLRPTSAACATGCAHALRLRRRRPAEMWFTRISIANPVLATMMMAALLVLGAFSYLRLPIEHFPDVALPVVVVQTEYPGAAPENVEEEVTRRI